MRSLGSFPGLKLPEMTTIWFDTNRLIEVHYITFQYNMHQNWIQKCIFDVSDLFLSFSIVNKFWQNRLQFRKNGQMLLFFLALTGFFITRFNGEDEGSM